MLQSVRQTNQTLVVTAKQKCDAFNTYLDMAEIKASNSDIRSKRALSDTDLTNTTIASLQEDLKKVEQLNSTAVQEIMQKVLITRQMFNQKQLQVTIRNLQAKLTEQKSYLTNAKSKKEELSSQVKRMGEIIQQLLIT